MTPPATPSRQNLAARLKAWQPKTGASKPNQKPKQKKPLVAVLREWHSRAGLVAFIFLIWLACTGVLLTRSVELGFDVKRIDWPWLMELYNLHPEPPQGGFNAGSHWLASTNDYTVLDGQPLAVQIQAPLGFLSGGTADSPVLYVASPSSLVLLRPNGERLDELTPPILPVSQLRRIGMVKGRPGVIAVQDLDAYQSADEGNSWTPISPTEVEWSQGVALPEAERSKLIEYSKPRVIVEQILIDLHSGRLFGAIGAWIITIIGFIAMVLAISGVWMWWRIRQNRKQRTQR